jgi:hypothetical protein
MGNTFLLPSWKMNYTNLLTYIIWDKKKYKKPVPNTVYKKLLVLAKPMLVALFASFWFSFGKSSCTNTPLSIYQTL